MTTELIQIGNNKKMLRVELVVFNQKKHSFYVAKMKADQFLHIYTVRPAQYDMQKHITLANSFQSDDTYYSHLITEDKNAIEEKDFQRDPDFDRIRSIRKYLEEEEFAFFPNTIISNCELINDWSNYNIDENSTLDDFLSIQNRPQFLSFLQRSNETYFLYIPYENNSILVIDGQHRLVGLENTEIEIQKNYDLLIAFIIGFDRSIIAKQFYTINYEQKPVNKSLLYQLTGEFTREINELSFLHNVVKLLNELDQSPFQGRIKMLGRSPRGVSPEEKSKYSISQSFLIDSTIRLLSSSARGSLYPPIFLRYFKNTSDHIYIVRILARYFNAVKIIKKDWDSPSQSILSKGMGVTALIKVLNLLFPVIFKKEMNNDWHKMSQITVDTFVGVLQGLEKVDFSTNGPYGKTGSAGSISKIKDDILSNLNYIGSPKDIKRFEENLKSTYLVEFDRYLT